MEAGMEITLAYVEDEEFNKFHEPVWLPTFMHVDRFINENIRMLFVYNLAFLFQLVSKGFLRTVHTFVR